MQNKEYFYMHESDFSFKYLNFVNKMMKKNRRLELIKKTSFFFIPTMSNMK